MDKYKTVALPFGQIERIWEADNLKALFRSFWVSEYRDDKLETKGEAPIPYEFSGEKKEIIPYP